MRKLLTLLFICLLASFAGAALAQTPDGDPPSVEQDCNDEVGAAFGLCNAYCEAMDCDCDGIECEAQASETACTRVAERFAAKTVDADNPEGRVPPCAETNEEEPCPCGVEGNWADQDAGFLWVSIILQGLFTDDATCTDNATETIIRDRLSDGGPVTQEAGVNVTGLQCVAADEFGVSGSLGISQGELANCQKLVRDAAFWGSDQDGPTIPCTQ